MPTVTERINALEKELEELKKKAAQSDVVESILQNYPNNCALWMEKRFNRHGSNYSFLALKTNGVWYLTGDKYGRMTNAELALFMTEPYPVGKVYRLVTDSVGITVA